MGGISEAEFAEVYLGRARAMRRTAYLLCGDWHRAEDLVQSAFARLYAAWPSIRDSGARRRLPAQDAGADLHR